ncbi:MAG TPA: anti-sigma factor [Pyrinomonadaceae bacterium]
MKHEEYREMLELAALDALGGEDVRTLEVHLSTCDECRAELAELRDAAAMLVFYAEPVAPAADLTARILNVPRTTPRAERMPGLEVTKGRDEGEQASTPSGFVPQWQAWRRWSQQSRLGAMAAALILIVLVVVLVVLWNRDRATRAELARLSSRNDEMQAELVRLARRNDELQAELARTSKHNEELQAELNRLPNRNNQRPGTTNPREPGVPATPGTPPEITENDSRVVELTATGVAARARARLSYNRRTGVIELVVSGMPSPPAGKTYQLWLLIDGSPVSAGTFNTGPGGRAMLHGQLAADALEASAFAVTLEPAGGSSKPTGPKYLLGSAL